MTLSRTIARIMGPTLILLGVTEALNLGHFARNPAPVVYLNGTLLLAAGVAILQAHNRWARDWTTTVTLTGWTLTGGGLYRMLFPTAPQATGGAVTYLMLALIAGVGILLAFKGYGSGARSPAPR